MPSTILVFCSSFSPHLLVIFSSTWRDSDENSHLPSKQFRQIRLTKPFLSRHFLFICPSPFDEILTRIVTSRQILSNHWWLRSLLCSLARAELLLIGASNRTFLHWIYAGGRLFSRGFFIAFVCYIKMAYVAIFYGTLGGSMIRLSQLRFF